MKIYIVTYNRNDCLNKTLDNLFSTDFSNFENTEVNIINNHSNFFLEERHKGRVNVIHNMTRPDYSDGNLARDWNTALVNGFKDLNRPDAKYVVTMHNDCRLHQDWVSNMLKMFDKGYTFLVGNEGDNVICYKPDAVKKIGLWDERIHGIYHKECDYMIRALMHNKDKSCINDTMHKRLLNTQDALPLDIGFDSTSDGGNKQWFHKKGQPGREHSTRLFIEKWQGTHSTHPDINGWLTNWSNDFINNPPAIPKMPSFIYYWFFEKDVENLREKGYAGF